MCVCVCVIICVACIYIYIYVCVCVLYLEVINNGNKEPTQFGRVTFYFGRVGRIGSQTVHPFGIARPPKAPGGGMFTFTLTGMTCHSFLILGCPKYLPIQFHAHIGIPHPAPMLPQVFCSHRSISMSQLRQISLLCLRKHVAGRKHQLPHGNPALGDWDKISSTHRQIQTADITEIYSEF